MGKDYTIKEWSIVWFLYTKDKNYLNSPHSFVELEHDMGYTKSQCGGVRKFLSYLVKEGVLKIKNLSKFYNIKSYIINKKRIDEIVINQNLYHIIASLYYGEMIDNTFTIPLPSKI